MKQKFIKFWQKIKPAVKSVGKLLIIISTLILAMCIIGSVWRSCKLRANADNIKSVSSPLSDDRLQTYDGKYEFLLPVGYNQALIGYGGSTTIPVTYNATCILDSVYMSFPINLGFNTAFLTLPDFSIDVSKSKITYNYKRIDLGEIKVNTPISFSCNLIAWHYPTYNTDLVQVYDCVYDPSTPALYNMPYDFTLSFQKYGAFNGVKSYNYIYQITQYIENQVPYYAVSINATFYSVAFGYDNPHDDLNSSDILTSFSLNFKLSPLGYTVYRMYNQPYIPYITQSRVVGNTYLSYVNPSETYENGYNNGYNQGYNEGKAQGNTEGYNNGYNNGYTDGRTAPEYSFTEFFTGFGQSFISIWDGITNYTFLGINIGGLIGVTLMISIVAIVVKKIGK